MNHYQLLMVLFLQLRSDEIFDINYYNSFAAALKHNMANQNYLITEKDIHILKTEVIHVYLQPKSLLQSNIFGTM